MSESIGNTNNFKRKRSSSSSSSHHHRGSSFRYPTPSSRQSLSTSCNTLTSYVTQASSSSPSKTCLLDSNPATEVRASASNEFKDQGTQTEVEVPETKVYCNWSGRGRSPFKTPATAAIDGLKGSSKYIEYVEREIVKEQTELDKVIRLKKDYFAEIARVRFKLLQDRMNPLQGAPDLAQPDIDTYEGRSRSPDKYIAKMRLSTPPVYYHRIETYRLGNLPKEIDQLWERLGENLGAGSVPSSYEVIKKINQRELLLISRIADNKRVPTSWTSHHSPHRI